MKNTIASVLLILFSLQLQAQPNPQPGKLKKLEDHVYVFFGTGGWILGSVILEDQDGLILIDTQFEDQNNKALIAEIKRIFPDKKVKTAVVSHAHVDHFMGLKFFRDAFGDFTVIGIKGEKEHMMQTATAFYSIYQNQTPNAELTVDDVIYPNKEIDGDFELNFSGRTVQFELIEQNESWRSLIAYLPDTHLLFLADMYWAGLVADPAVGASVLGWHKELKNVMNRKAGTIIPGHGTDVVSREAVDRWLVEVGYFIETSRKLIKEAFAEHQFKEQVNFFGDKKAHLGRAYDEIKQNLENKSGTN